VTVARPASSSTSNAAAEPLESLGLSLANPTGGATLGAIVSAVLNVHDDDRLIDKIKGRKLESDAGGFVSGTLATFTSYPFVTAADFSARILWGDGTETDGSISFNAATGEWEVGGTHTYTNGAKVQHATVIVTDSRGHTRSVNATIKRGRP
jgi:hypothetical protein